MYLMIDNYDSFVYNLACYLRENGAEVDLVRSDQITMAQITPMLEAGTLQGLILSPGPKSPQDCGNCREILKGCQGKIPVLGVCLGHQIIGSVYGGTVTHGEKPMHGKISIIHHSGQGLFRGLPESFQVTRYHSLVVRDQGFPGCLQVDARSQDGVIMGLHHVDYPIYGVQFHPEAVLTQYGHELLQNFMNICDTWRTKHENSHS